MSNETRRVITRDCRSDGKGALSKSGLVGGTKVKLFYDMFNFLALYYGSDNKVIIQLDLKDKFIRYKMKDRMLNKDNAQKILDGYNAVKLENNK